MLLGLAAGSHGIASVGCPRLFPLRRLLSCFAIGFRYHRLPPRRWVRRQPKIQKMTTPPSSAFAQAMRAEIAVAYCHL